MTDAERLATIHALLLEEMADATDDTVKLAEYAVAALRGSSASGGRSPAARA